ncbi:MAG TPA: TetR/AcrR family transcriptional regulator [Flammeovirgaceae bacterium]|nr:TetR/AcrR family transcriptional regulator [Flammeovirgaceae bacterium]
MPHKTFYNLPEGKRSRFLQAAYAEFARHGYEGASISRLVMHLGIAKGSVYQYFTDKKELYHYLAKEAFRQVEALLRQACPWPGGDFYTWYESLLMAEVKYYLHLPHRALVLQQATGTLTEPAADFRAQRLAWLKPHLPQARQQPMHLELLWQGPRVVFNYLLRNYGLQLTFVAGEHLSLKSDKLVSTCLAYSREIKSS